MPAGSNPYPRWKAIETVPQEISPEIWLRGMAEALCFPRPPGFFEYLLRCPAARFRLYGIVDGGARMGHFAIGVLRGQARVAGLWLRDPSRETWAAAYYLAQKTARRLKEAYEVVAVGTDGASGESAALAGLRIKPGSPVFLLDKRKKLSLAPDFQFQLSDDDEAFLDIGTASYWS